MSLQARPQMLPIDQVTTTIIIIIIIIIINIVIVIKSRLRGSSINLLLWIYNVFGLSLLQLHCKFPKHLGWVDHIVDDLKFVYS